MNWYEVTATVKVEALSEREAINRVAHSITTTNVPGLHPVGAFKAQPCEDPADTRHVHLPAE